MLTVYLTISSDTVTYITLSYVYDLDVLIFEKGWGGGGGETGVSGEKPSKHRRDQLRQLNSHETQVQAPTGLGFFRW